MKHIALTITIFLSVLWERLMGYKTYTSYDSVYVDIGVGVCNSIGIGFVILLITSNAIHPYAIVYLHNWFISYSIIALIIGLIYMELHIYWYHRLSHTIPFLWKFHSFHHSEKEMNVFSAYRFHAIEVLLSAGSRAIGFWLLSLPWYVWALYEVIFTIQNVLQHANIDFGPTVDKWYSFLFISPRNHKIHHADNSSFPDANFSTVFSVTDRVFKSYFQPKDISQIEFGLKK